MESFVLLPSAPRKTTSYFSQPKPRVREAKDSDVDALVQIYLSAFASNLCSRLAFSSVADYEVEVEVKRNIEDAVRNPKIIVMNAVYETPGESNIEPEIVGLAIWVPVELGNVIDGWSRLRPLLMTLSMATPRQQLPLGSLVAYLIEREHGWLLEWMARKKFLVLATLATKSTHQGKHIDTELLRWGCKMADNKALPCCLSATPTDVRMYRSNGFKEVGKLELDMADWAADVGLPKGTKASAARKAEMVEMGWGRYVSKYMIRLPETFK